jgi:hypothetical protein
MSAMILIPIVVAVVAVANPGGVTSVAVFMLSHPVWQPTTFIAAKPNIIPAGTYDLTVDDRVYLNEAGDLLSRSSVSGRVTLGAGGCSLNSTTSTYSFDGKTPALLGTDHFIKSQSGPAYVSVTFTDKALQMPSEFVDSRESPTAAALSAFPLTIPATPSRFASWCSLDALGSLTTPVAGHPESYRFSTTGLNTFWRSAQGERVTAITDTFHTWEPERTMVGSELDQPINPLIPLTASQGRLTLQTVSDTGVVTIDYRNKSTIRTTIVLTPTTSKIDTALPARTQTLKQSIVDEYSSNPKVWTVNDRAIPMPTWLSDLLP